MLADNNLPPPAGRARIRFVNSSPDLGAFDVYINFSKQVSGLATNSASAYNEVAADATIGTAFEFDFNLAGTTTPVLKLPNTVIVGEPHVHDLRDRRRDRVCRAFSSRTPDARSAGGLLTQLGRFVPALPARIIRLPRRVIQARPGHPQHALDPGSLAQLVEQRTLNPLVEGSIPSRPTNPRRPQKGLAFCPLEKFWGITSRFSGFPSYSRIRPRPIQRGGVLG